MNGLLTVDKVAELLEITRQQVCLLIRSGKLIACNIGLGSKKPRYRIKETDLDLFLSSDKKRKAKHLTRVRTGTDKVREYFGL